MDEETKLFLPYMQYSWESRVIGNPEINPSDKLEVQLEQHNCPWAYIIKFKVFSQFWFVFFENWNYVR